MLKLLMSKGSFPNCKGASRFAWACRCLWSCMAVHLCTSAHLRGLPDVQCIERWYSDTSTHQAGAHLAQTGLWHYQTACGPGSSAPEAAWHAQTMSGADEAATWHAPREPRQHPLQQALRTLDGTTGQHSMCGAGCPLNDTLSRLKGTLCCAQGCHTCSRPSGAAQHREDVGQQHCPSRLDEPLHRALLR